MLMMRISTRTPDVETMIDGLRDQGKLTQQQMATFKRLLEERNAYAEQLLMRGHKRCSSVKR